PDGGVRAARMRLLDPRRLGASTAACLTEISFLTNAREEARLATDGYRARIAERLADAVARYLAAARGPARVETGAISREESFDIWHEVPLVPQLTGMSCWAAAAAMIIGWRDRIPVAADEVARGAGHWAAYREGLEPADVPSLARAWGLTIAPPRVYSLRD